MGYDIVMTSSEFIDKLQLAVNSKTLYVMGAFGAPATAKNKKRYANSCDYNKRADRSAKINAASSDTFFFDCVCLIKGILWGWCADASKVYGGADYASNGVPDMTINAITSQCSDYSSYIWDNLVPGEWLHLDGDHCGVYIGNGLAIESTPSWADGVQITAVGNIGPVEGFPTRNWTGHGKLPWIDYGTQPEPPTPPTPTKRVDEDGWWGTQVTTALQEIFGCRIVDGIVSRQANSDKQWLPHAAAISWEFKGWPGYIGGSAVIKALQAEIGTKDDGHFGYNSVGALQVFLRDRGFYGGEIDHSMGPATVLALQRWINAI